MSVRLVIPAGADPAVDGPREGVTWQEVAAESGCEAIEFAGSPWCIGNGIDGLGICTERPTPPSPVDPGPLFDQSALDSAAAAVQAATTVSTLRAAVLKVVSALGG